MHSSLKRSTSLTIQAAGTLVVGLSFLLFRLGVVLPVVAGILAGVATGLMRSLAIRASAAELGQARTGKDVRAAITSTPEGRISGGLLWIGVAAIAVVTKLGGDPAFFYRFLAGFLALLVAREAMAFSALSDVERAAAAPPIQGSAVSGQDKLSL